jgi:uncharacterized protein YuzE
MFVWSLMRKGKVIGIEIWNAEKRILIKLMAKTIVESAQYMIM